MAKNPNIKDNIRSTPAWVDAQARKLLALPADTIKGWGGRRTAPSWPLAILLYEGL
jgi:hypothetical protein